VKKGKVYPSTPGVTVRITGNAPLDAYIWEQEKLRCNLCGEIFTAPLPKGVGDTKYDETAGAMIALLKYGSGLPFNRLEEVQEGLGIPLPASTQWDIVEKAARLCSSGIQGTDPAGGARKNHPQRRYDNENTGRRQRGRTKRDLYYRDTLHGSPEKRSPSSSPDTNMREKI